MATQFMYAVRTMVLAGGTGNFHTQIASSAKMLEDILNHNGERGWRFAGHVPMLNSPVTHAVYERAYDPTTESEGEMIEREASDERVL